MKVRLLLMSLGALVSLTICWGIELLNWLAGGMLPRKLPEHGNPKWRVLGNPVRQLTAEYEREYRISNNLDNDAPLPAEVIDQIQARVSIEAPPYQARANLTAAVGSWGLWQYPLSLLLIVSGAVHAARYKNRTLRIACCSIASVGCVCFGMAYYRAYFGSLGW
jgi:hypothetical protein